MRVRAKVASAAMAVAAIGGTAAISAPAASAHHEHHRKGAIQHVVLISVDGMHQSDLNWYVAHHPDSTLAQLARGGAEFTNNHTAVPSDSDPGGTALMTGGDPRSTGVFYDVEYSHAVDEAGAPCTPGQPATGGDVIYDSPDDKLNSVPDFLYPNVPPTDPNYQTFPSFDEGGSIYPNGQDTNPGLIMGLSPHPQSGLNPGSYPVDPATCQPIQPWDYLKVNTIFQVIQQAGMRTAWSDKHAVYSSFNGPGSNGQAIDDFFAPEIDSQAVEPNGTPYPSDTDWAHDDAATKQYDNYKVDAVLNELNGRDHSGQYSEPVPGILGMNFQAVSVAEKLNTPSELYPNQNGIPTPGAASYTEGPTELGGYYPGGQTPRPLLASALDYVNYQLSRMIQTIQADGLANSTAIIVTAKHGQSPQDPNQLKRIKDGPIIDAINAAWTQQTGDQRNLIVAGTDDDLWQSYLSVKTQQAADFVKSYLWNHPALAVNYANTGAKCPYPVPSTVPAGCTVVQHSGLAQIYAGQEAADFFGVPYNDPRYPDVFGRVQVGTVYTGGTKLAEHGGDNPGDRRVPLIVYAPGAVHRMRSGAWVETTQVAPTILRLLGLDPYALQAVQQEGTQVLPGLDERSHWSR